MAVRRGVVVVLVLILMAVAISAAGLLFMGLAVGRGPQISSNSTLLLDVSGDLQETEPSGVLGQFLEAPPTVRSLVDALRKASVDRRVSSVIIRPTGNAALWGKVQEVRDAIIDFKKSGKPIIAYLEYGGDQSYYLASACDKVFLMPTASLDLTGMATYELFLRGTLDKIGAFPDAIHVGDYKTASNTFTEQTFTPAHREMAESLNTDLYEQLIAGLADGRHRTAAEMRDARRPRAVPARGRGARRASSTTWPTRTRSTTRSSSGAGAPARCGSSDYRQRRPHLARAQPRAADRRDLRRRHDQPGASSYDSPSGPGRRLRHAGRVPAQGARGQLDPRHRAADRQPRRIGVASDVIWREIMLTRERKPVIASMSDVAASGGYYIAMPAHAIVAQPATLTGSIGVVSLRFVIDGTLDEARPQHGDREAGQVRRAVFAGPAVHARRARRRSGSRCRRPTTRSSRRRRPGRNTTPERIDAIAQGRVWTGRQAKEIGLVDELGGLDRALAIAKERAKIAPGSEVELVVYPPKKSLFEVVSEPWGRSDSSATLDALLGVRERPRRRGRDRPAAPVPPRRAAGADAECVCEVDSAHGFQLRALAKLSDLMD